MTKIHAHDRLWALAPEMAESVFSAYDEEHSRIRNEANPAPALTLSTDENVREAAEAITRRAGRVAVIAIGAPIDRTSLFGFFSGGMFAVGQDAIKAAFTQALADPMVGAILFSVNSPGGVVSGTKELADFIADSRSVKPLAAYVDGVAASGAYWLASATGRVLAPVTGQVGSIGVIMQLADFSGFYQRAGIRFEYIASGKWKAAGRGERPLTDEERAYFQERLSAIHAVFRNDVAARMNIAAPPDEWAEAQVMLASRGKTVGLVSEIVRDEAAAIQTLEVSMSHPTREALAEEAPELLDALLREGRKAAEAENAEKLVQAGKAGAACALAAMRVVCKAEDVKAVETLMEKARTLGLNAEQLAGMAELFPRAEAVSAGEKKVEATDGKSALLAALTVAHGTPVHADSPTRQEKSPLVADAERRAAVAAQ